MRLLSTILFFTLSLSAIAQTTPVILNGSFENWTMYQGYEYPDNWEPWDTLSVELGALTKVNNASKGSYSIHLGSYSDQGYVTGSAIDLRDTLPTPIGGITFDYRVQNNDNQFGNGLQMRLYWYDENGNFIIDLKWTTPFLTNNSNFETKKLPYDSPSNARSYLLVFQYINADAGINEYAEVDNVKFQDFGTGVDDAKAEQLCVYPNPTSGLVSIEGLSVVDMGAIRITNMCGQTHTFEPASTLDLSNLAAGIYLMDVVDRDGKHLRSQKLTLNK